MFKMMDPNEDAESHEDRPPSPYWVLQHLSEEAFRVAGEALHSVYSVNLDFQPMQTAHRRSHSEVGSTGQLRTNSFHKLKSRMQKAWQRGGNTRDQSFMSSFNPEVLANQKRQWYQLHSKALDHKKYKEPTSLFEHFVIAGLHPDANLEAVEDAFARRKRWELEMAKPEMMEFKGLQHRAPSFPSMEPQILFRYPLGKRLPLRLKDLAAFCFPAGVKTCLLERTPSLNELNELIYGQEHLGRDDLSFIFSLKVADHDTLYGVCLHVTEIAQRPPGILGNSSPLSHPSRRPCRFLVSAPRCYCVLTRVPFFELHYEMLNSIIAQERLSRITQFVNELSITSYMPLPVSGHHDQVNANDDCRDKLYGIDLMASAIPVDSAVALSAAAAGIITDDEMQALSPKILEPHSPESVTCSEASCFSQAREVDKDCKRSLQCYDDCASESSENHSDTFERSYGNCENDQASPDIGRFSCSKSSTLERLGSFDFSPVKSRASEDEDEDLFSSHEKDFGDALIMEWARETKNDLLSIVCGYHAMTVPERGSVIVFCPLEHLQAIEYARPLVSDLGIYGNYPDSFETAKVNANLAAAEEAFALSIWTTATICRVLSLECILALITGVLLEKQVVVVCPNLGVLSAMVLSLVPMIRPFQWQSLFLPILPGTMLDFLDAPVPFIVGLQNKPADLKIKTSNLVHVNIQKDRVKTCHLPTLPRYKELVRELGPIHARLSFEGPIARKHPVYRCNEVQAEAATQFLNVMRRYMESLCSDLRSHTITSVESNNDRVSLLLKDSFIDSFPSRDRSFIRVLVDTQLFAVLSDCRLSSFENGRL